MLPIHRVLTPVDFTDTSIGIIPFAQEIAARYGAELILLHVESDRELGKFRRDPLHEFNVRRVLYDGDPADVIVGFVKSKKVDLIVMPTHGYGQFRRFLVGSVTAKILHDLECPVLTGVHVPQPPPVKIAELHDVLCAIDLGSESSEVLKWASRLAADFRLPLDLVHAVPAFSPGQSLALSNDWRAEVANLAGQGLERAASAAGLVAAGAYVEEGDPAKTVCTLANKLRSGVLVIGRGPRDRMGGRLTTHSYSIIRQSPCPVLSI